MENSEISDVFELLVRENPREQKSVLRLYADAFRIYTEATRNLSENGAIVMHPRTGTPLENPYLKVQAQASRTLQKLSSQIPPIKTAGLWEKS